MLATISPASNQIDETLSTLRYACQARTIINRVKVNEAPHDRIIRELKAEVERLKAMAQDYERINERQKRNSGGNNGPRKIIIETSVDESEIEILKQQLALTEKDLARAQTKWEERLTEVESVRRAEMKLVKKNGLALELTFEEKQALLVNLSPNLSQTGKKF